MTGFWKTWMFAWCAATLALGAIFAAAAFPATDAVARLYYDAVYWPLDGRSAFAEDLRFTVAVLGAVLIGWAITIYGMIAAAERVGAPVWRTLTFAMLAWFGIDSALSVAAGVPVNAIANTGFLVTYLLPVLASGVLRENARLAAA
ncbi:MAG: hypothetical protein GC206_05015 [Alphaproteobacteria bacterium]|nr:hypothetical protein [Alphaproteobacteria bacterium]